MQLTPSLGRVKDHRKRHSMATKIKIITARDFLEVTPDGIINIATSGSDFLPIVPMGTFSSYSF